jgi:hypothetical protein
LVIKKALLSAAIALGAAMAVATPAGADPSAFGTLGCSCTQPVDVPHGKPAVKDQLNQGIQSGLGSLHGGPPSPGGF